ncbi:hypothetical protein TRP8649_01399 [Pelagimonas phthalicica]|uniref:Uncharacterized protein n=1 Tax=Pelagimonas phthalicica TaxID=1037362 RepID=A0A238JBR3_9RHOB|nr:hypothetical protein [Pelagimonas phthalicica]TDS94179.1 hypothetical protein CLV87_0673 [Pelagimonas phthalicica]SMX27296.1 hypothetical protein TRP8649_01399 [Pelagimonas phthalicica]
MDPMQNLNNAADALNLVAQRAGGFWDDADARISAKEAEVNAFISGARDGIIKAATLHHDPSVIHTKVSLAAAADPANNLRTEWIEIDPLHSDAVISAQESATAILHLSRQYSFSDGGFEEPPYSTNWSRTWFRAVLATAGTTSSDIDNRLAELALVPDLFGSWGSTVAAVEVPIVDGVDGGWNKRLFIRFENTTHSGTGAPQPVLTHGGNAQIAVNGVSVYNV